MTERNFVCNRTSELFLKDTTSKVKLLFGCVGSGKSSTCDIDLFTISSQLVQPGYDGIRRSRWAIIRSTYSQLKTTTIKTWQEWFPPETFGDIHGDSPMTHHIKNGDLDMEVIFLALDSLADLNRLKSLELTGAYINEAQFVYSTDVISNILERTSRYPGKIFGGGLGRHLLIMDCNPPSTNHWIYEKFEIEKPDGWSIYKMPPAIIQDDSGSWINNPNADFIDQQLNKNYWVELAKGANSEYIKTSLRGEYGTLVEGRPVHPEFNDRLHYSSKRILANENCEIGLGWDFGNTPACAVVQLFPDGQMVVIDEFWTEYMSVREFAEKEVIPQLDKFYPFWRQNYASRHDPAGQAMNSNGKTCQGILHELGIISLPAASNALQFRRDALKYYLTRMASGNPGFILSDKCHMLREGLRGEFHYPLIKSSVLAGSKMYQEKPLKNIFSHICEGLEYISTHYARTSKDTSPNKQSVIYEKMAAYNNKISSLKEQSWRK